MAEGAGTYLSSLELLRAFKRSDCGYALRRDFSSVDTALAAEVLPAFPPNVRNEVSMQMQRLKPMMSKQAEDYVGSMIAEAKRKQDRNTACGNVAGLLTSVSSQAYQNWLTAKQQYGWRH